MLCRVMVEFVVVRKGKARQVRCVELRSVDSRYVEAGMVGYVKFC